MVWRLVEEEEEVTEEQPTNLSQKIKSQLRPDPSLQRVGRQVKRGAARVGETLAGLPGDYASLPFSTMNLIANLTGSETPPPQYEEAQKILPILPPTGAQIKEKTQALAPSLKPQNKVEKFGDEILEDATALLSRPSKAATKAPKYAKKFLKSIGVAVGSNVAAEGVGEVTGSEKAKSYTKMGTMLFLDMLKKNPQKAVDKEYAKATALLKPNVTTKVTRLPTTIEKLRKMVSKGTDAPSEKFVKDELNKLERKIKPGKRMGVEEISATKRSLNEKLSEFIYNSSDRTAKARARKLLNQVQSDLKSELQEYGKKQPEWWKAYQNAEGSHAALAKSKVVGNFIKNNLSKKLVYYPLASFLVGNPGAIASTLKTGSVAFIPYKTLQIGYRIYKSPVLRKHYTDLVKAAARNDAAAMNKNALALQKKLKEEDKKAPKYTLLD